MNDPQYLSAAFEDDNGRRIRHALRPLPGWSEEKMRVQPIPLACDDEEYIFGRHRELVTLDDITCQECITLIKMAKS